MELLIKSFVDPGCYMYLSGIIVVILGAFLGITPPDSRKNLNTSMAIPIFIAIGLAHVFHSFDYLAGAGSNIIIHNLLQIIIFICSVELGRRNISVAYKKNLFSPYWYIPAALAFLFLFWNYNVTYRLIANVLVFVAKLFAVIVTVKAADNLVEPSRHTVKASFNIAAVGAILQLILDLPFSRIEEGHYLQPPQFVAWLYWFESALALCISIIVMRRRYIYEMFQRLHVPSKIFLFSPTVVFIASLVFSFGVLVGSNYLSFREIQNQNLESQSANLNLKNVISQKMDFCNSSARLLADNPLLAILFETGSINIKNSMKRFLVAFKEQNQSIDFYVMNASSTVIISSDKDYYTEGKSMAAKEYYKSAISGQPSFTILKDTHTQALGFYATYPVLSVNRKSILGVITLRSGLSEIENIISLSRFPAMFINSRGRVLMAGNKSLINSQCGDLSVYFDKGMIPIRKAHDLHELVKTDGYFSVASIKNSKWAVLSLSGLDTGNSTQIWMLFITLLVIFILNTILYGIAHNSEALKSVEKAQTNFKKIFDNAPESICVVDSESYTIIAMNKSMEEHFGYGLSLIGQKLDDFIVSSNSLSSEISKITDVVISECEFKKATGETFSGEITASNIELDSGKDAVLLSIHDITMFKNIEDKLIEAKNAAEEATQLKARFFANASHEIRTPMTAIIGLTELAVSICYNENQRNIIELLRISSKSLMSLINDIFGLAEAQSGKLHIVKSTLKLNTLLDEIICYSKFQAQRDNKTIDFKLSKYLPEHICSDQDHLRQILLTAVIQAFALSSDNGINIEIDFKDEVNNSGNLVVRLLGIDSGKRKEIESSLKNEYGFDPYEASASRKHSLSISLNSMIINQMGGSIALYDSKTDKNELCICITIPVDVVELKAIEAEQNENEAVFYSAGKPLHFLIADDNDVNLFLAQSIITRLRGTSQCVKDGLEVLEALKSNTFDAILLDIQMPKMDGMKVLEELKKMPENLSSIPVIAISAFASAEEREKALRAGARTYLSKPYFPKDLLDAIGSIFKLDKEVPASVKAAEISKAMEAAVAVDKSVKKNFSEPEKLLTSRLRRIDYVDFKVRISPKAESMKQLIDIYNRRYTSLDIEIDNSINDNDAGKLREVAHSIKGLVGMMSAKYSWEIARTIEKCAAENKMDEAMSHISELRQHLAEIGDDLLQIQKFLNEQKA